MNFATWTRMLVREMMDSTSTSTGQRPLTTGTYQLHSTTDVAAADDDHIHAKMSLSLSCHCLAQQCNCQSIGLRTVTRGHCFSSRPLLIHITTLRMLFTYICLSHETVQFSTGQRIVKLPGYYCRDQMVFMNFPKKASILLLQGYLLDILQAES